MGGPTAVPDRFPGRVTLRGYRTLLGSPIWIFFDILLLGVDSSPCPESGVSICHLSKNSHEKDAWDWVHYRLPRRSLQTSPESITDSISKAWTRESRLSQKNLTRESRLLSPWGFRQKFLLSSMNMPQEGILCTFCPECTIDRMHIFQKNAQLLSCSS